MKKNINEAVDVSSVIKGMQGNFGGDNESQMKGLQLLKGLATSDDPKANQFMKALNTATTKISKEVLGDKSESVLSESHLSIGTSITVEHSEGDVTGSVFKNDSEGYLMRVDSSRNPYWEVGSVFYLPDDNTWNILVMESTPALGATLTEGADAYCPNCGENNGKASEAMDDNGQIYCDNCGTTYFYESTSAKDNIKEAKAKKCKNCGETVPPEADITDTCPSCGKPWNIKVNEAGSKTAKCPQCGGKYLVDTGYCVSCKKKVADMKGGKKADKKADDKKKENIISVDEDVKVGNIILEKGDQIRIIESMGWIGTNVVNDKTGKVFKVIAENNFGSYQELTLDNGVLIKTSPNSPDYSDENGYTYSPV